MPSGPVALLGSRANRASDTSSVVKLTSHRAWSHGSGSVGVGSGWSLELNTDVKYSLNIDAISAGLETVRVGVDTPSPTPIDMVSGKLDSILLSLNTDQNLFGLLRRLESRELKKLVRFSLIIFFTLALSSLNLARRESVGELKNFCLAESFFWGTSCGYVS